MKYIPSIAFEEMSGSEKKKDLSRCSGPVTGTTPLRRPERSGSHSADGKNGPHATAVAARGSASDSNFRCRNEALRFCHPSEDAIFFLPRYSFAGLIFAYFNNIGS